MSESRARLVTLNLIDADSCVFNENHRLRVADCISRHRHIFEEFANKLEFTHAETYLLDLLAQDIISRQKNFSRHSDAHQDILDECEDMAKRFCGVIERSEPSKSLISLHLAKFIFTCINQMEKTVPAVLRDIFRQSNWVLMSHLEMQIETVDEFYLGLGSNRQCYPCDELNSRERGTSSIYVELAALQEYLQIKFPAKKINLEKFTLNDLNRAKAHSGDSFDKILKNTPLPDQNAFDSSKVNIVYAACHRLACKKPGAKLIVNMWDDHKGILDGIKLFFTNYPELLPKGLKLRLYRYDGKLRKIRSCVGVGDIDKNYKKNTMLMATMCGYDVATNDIKLNIAATLDMAAFLQKRVTVIEAKEKVSGGSIFRPKIEPTIEESPALLQL